MAKSLTTFAKEQNISKQAVSKQIKKYEKELEGHIDKSGKAWVLDEYAVHFLESKRQAVIIVSDNSKDVIERLKEEKQELINQQAAAAKLIADLTAKLLDAQNNANQLALEMKDLTHQIEMKDADLQAMNELQETNNNLVAENGQLEDELKSYKKTWFGFYKKTK